MTRSWLITVHAVLLCVAVIATPTFAEPESTQSDVVSSAALVSDTDTIAESAPSPIQRANAQTATVSMAGAQSPAPAPVGSAAHLMNVMLGLGAIIALILGLSWFAKRFGQGNFSGGNVMKVIATLPLGTRERLLLVDVGGKHILLGVTPTAINALHSFDEPVIVPERQEPSEFARKLMSVIQQKNSADSNEKPLS